MGAYDIRQFLPAKTSVINLNSVEEKRKLGDEESSTTVIVATEATSNLQRFRAYKFA